MLARRASLPWLIGLIAVTRLCHLRLVWIEEAYGSAAASQLLRGSHLYRDLWFDKPPLYAWIYEAWGAASGLPLRLGGIVFASICCFVAYNFGKSRWSEAEGVAAAWFLGLSITFGPPSAVLALAPDLLLVLPHLTAVFLAWKEKPLLAGVAAGVGFLCNTKAVVLLAVCLLWQWQAALWVLAGFALPNAFFVSYLWLTGGFDMYVAQVWTTGWMYAADTFVVSAWSEALKRTLNWVGFHAAICVSAGVWLWRERDWRWGLWILLSLATVFAGWRFFPRYYFALLPPLCIAAGRGFVLLSARCRMIILLVLLIPVIRFAPGYWKAATGAAWSDTALMDDSKAAATLIHPGSSLFVWGYRPDVYVFSGAPAGSAFLDSQPINGVFADRHLFSEKVSVKNTEEQIKKLSESRPDYIVDGLGLLNPRLSLTTFQPLQSWFLKYREVARTRNSIVYKRDLEDSK